MSGSKHDQALSRTVVRVLSLQAALGGLFLVAALVWVGIAAAMAVLFGSALGILGTILSAREVRRARVGRRGDAPSVMPIYLGALQKLLIIAVGVAFGLVVLELRPMYLLAGLILSQISYMAASLWSLASDR